MSTLNECARQLGAGSKLWYAADNYFGTATSWGFNNTWFVIAFDSLLARNLYVSETNSLTCRAIFSYQIKDNGGVELLHVDGKVYQVYMDNQADESTYWAIGEDE